MITSRFALVLTLALGCSNDKKDGGGGKKEEGPVASCKNPSLFMCREYRGGNLALGEEPLKELCLAAGGKDVAFTSEPCPTDKLLGACKAAEYKDYFYEGFGQTTAELEEACKFFGDSTFSKP
jgi:hypothetical protein